MNLLQFLKGKREKEDAWRAVARRVLAGGYDDAATSTLKSITIGLSAIQHPECQAALIKITGIKERL